MVDAKNIGEFFKYSRLKEFLIHMKNISNVMSLADWNGCNGIILRHDIDLDIKPAYDLFLIEKGCGVKSTFFIMTTCSRYSPLSMENRKILCEIADNGFEIGLHFDPTVYSDLSESELKEKVDIEAKLLQSIIQKKVVSISLHNPSRHGRFLLFDGYKNACQEDISSNEHYLSDTYMGKHFLTYNKDPFEFVKRAKNQIVQVSLHPCQYTEKGDYVELRNRKRISYNISDVLKESGIEHYELIGNPNMNFSKFSTIWDGEKDSIAYCIKERVRDPVKVLNECESAVIIADRAISCRQEYVDKAVVLVDNPKEVFIKIMKNCFPIEIKRGEIHPSSVIGDKAIIHPSAIIRANVIINDCVSIGENVIIDPNTVVGYDGFGYNINEKGYLENFPHHGGVIIEDYVEIGSNVSIDRGGLGNTIIKRGTKIDNLCHIAHNVVIGENCMIVAGVAIGGSVAIGNNSFIGINAALRDGINIGKNVLVGMGAVVTKNVQDNAIIAGNPARFLRKND